MLFPNGKNHLHDKRSTKLTDQQYFDQRIRNSDSRFVDNTGYVYAAAAYLEKKQLQRNIDISYRRGTQTTNKKGEKTYKLTDAYSVFDKITNTPKYWQTAKYEMLARLDNDGPFQFFFTLSCADTKWDENFSSLLHKKGFTLQYEMTDTKSITYVSDKHGDKITFLTKKLSHPYMNL